MTNSVGFFCKTFKPDFDQLGILLESYVRHNPDNLKLTLSLPRNDVAAFKDRFGTGIPNLHLVCDSDYCSFDLSRIPGWYGQQLCKLTSWRATGADHYAVLDSDFYFIRDVRADDLLPRKGKDYVVYGSTIRAVLRPDSDNDLLFRFLAGKDLPEDTFPPLRPAPNVDFTELHSHKNSNTDEFGLFERSGLIFRLFSAKKWYFYQPGQFFSSSLLRDFEHFINENGMTLQDAILLAPWEYNWYSEYAAAFHNKKIDFRVSPTIHFPSKESIDMALKMGLTEAVLAEKFAWIAMAARHHTAFRLNG